MREPSGNKQKRKKEKGKNERMGEPSGRCRCRKKERLWTKEYTRVWWDKIQEKKKKEKEKVTYGGKKKKGKVLEITISKYYHNIFTIFSQ